MSLLTIAWRSIQQRRLASCLTAFSMALGVALVVTVVVVHRVVRDSFTAPAGGYHLVVGKKGSKLQLVLNTVYHLQEPIENIPYSVYTDFLPERGGKYIAYAEFAIPYCLGDNYEGFRVVGTTPDMFEKLQYANQRRYEFEEGGRNFKAENFFEAVIGSGVARQTGLGVGDEFQPTHGVTEEADGHKHDAFNIVGVLKPTGTANDRALFINMEGFFLLEGHADTRKAEKEPAEGDDAAPEDTHLHAENDHAGHSHEPLPEEQREVTALLVKARNDVFANHLHNGINEGVEAQAVYPIQVVQDFFDKLVKQITTVLKWLAALIIVEAGISILVSIYNSMSDRRREIAVMRALGAGRGTVMNIVLIESILLSVGGGLAGIVLGHGLIGVLSPFIAEQTSVSISFLEFDIIELALIPTLILLAVIIGFLPAVVAYRTDVAKALTSNP